jgi:hypothetical protein
MQPLAQVSTSSTSFVEFIKCSTQTTITVAVVLPLPKVLPFDLDPGLAEDLEDVGMVRT